jgi:anti-sigma B factor antagonist
MALGIERADDHEITVVTLRGKMTLGEDCREWDDLVPGLVSEGRTKLIFDLSGVTHIDSTGIGRFIDTYSKLGKLGGKMRLAGAEGTVRESFRVTRLDTVFLFSPTVEEARAEL